MNAPAIGPGRLVLVVGPSGAGKDTLLDRARLLLCGDPSLIFPARSVTRPAHRAEDNVELSEAAFAADRDRGAFALHWRAHGLAYGVPATIDEAIRAGSTVVLNVSRSVVAAARARYANTLVVLVDAPPSLRAERLAARGREEAEAIPSRLESEARNDFDLRPDVTIVNDGGVEAGAASLAAAIRSSADEPPAGQAAPLTVSRCLS